MLLQAWNLLLKASCGNGEVSGCSKLVLFSPVATMLFIVISKILKDMVTRSKKPQCFLCLMRLDSFKEQNHIAVNLFFAQTEKHLNKLLFQ